MGAPDNLIDKTFAESVALTVEARNYIAYHEQAGRPKTELAMNLEVGYQHTRISARLIQIMTWLLALKAYNSGEISRDQWLGPQYALVPDETCSDSAGIDDEHLPPGLRNLLDRTHKLYLRILRLDEAVRRTQTARPEKTGMLRVVVSNDEAKPEKKDGE